MIELKNPECFDTIEFNRKSSMCKSCRCFKECKKAFRNREAKIK